MTPAISTRNSTADIIAALTAAVTGVQFKGANAFSRVEFFDVEDIAEAAQFLLITEQRACVIVPLEERFEAAIKGPLTVLTRRLPIVLLISDRVIGSTKRKVALLGDANTPGAQGLVDLTLPAVTGLLIAPIGGATPVGGVKCLPTDSVVMKISSKDQPKLPGRVCIALSLECTGGTLTANTGPGNIL